MIKFFTLFLLATQMCVAQQAKEGKVGAMVNYVLSKNMDKDALMRTPQGKVYFFTVTLLFDEGGKVDTVFFSKKLDSDAQDIMGLNAGLVKKIKEQRVSYKMYARKAVVVPIYFYRRTDEGVLYSSGFLSSIENLLPKENPQIQNKEWIIVDPIINPFVRIEN